MLKPRLAEARDGKRTVYFVDASHFVLASFMAWVCCFVRLHVRAASGRQRYNVLRALNAVTHELVTEINTTYITAISVCTFLQTIANRGHSVPITLVRDNARCQKCVLVTDAAKAMSRVVVLAVVFAQSEPDRAVVEVREEGSV